MRLTGAERKGNSAQVVRLSISNGEEARAAAAQLKAVALRLFADRGVDGVTVREIAAAAGQKNHGAVGYYFGSKEQLVRELVIDGAVEMDRLRNAELDRLEAAGGPISVRQVVDVLIRPAVETGARIRDYNRFIVMLSMTHRELMMDALENRWNSGYQRCLKHLRALMPPMPRILQNQRFVFMGAYLGGVLARREQALGDDSRPHPIWSAAFSLEHFAQSLTALLEAPFEGEARPAGRASDGDADLKGPHG
jgi:AcrR family transcriptional regulator